jgi:hypothetical protein
MKPATIVGREVALHSNDKRRAHRILVDLPIVAESIGQPRLSLHPTLERIYQRVHASEEGQGELRSGAIRDLSTNGAFIAADPLPLLSRVAIRFSLEDHGPIEAVGWTLWRRSEDCEIPLESGQLAHMPRGFGVLFEAIPLEARLAIHKMVLQAFKVSS